MIIEEYKHASTYLSNCYITALHKPNDVENPNAPKRVATAVFGITAKLIGIWW